jgi:N-acetylneuraminate synthase
MRIGNREINSSQPPYVVAEISGNHSGNLFRAKELIKAAKRAGADAVKTQCYEPDTITLPCNKADFIIQDGLWKGRTLYELYEAAHTPFKWHPELYKLARDLEITIFSSVFDHSSIEFLERLGCPAYKIASMEIVDIPLIQRAAATNKPLIISTGMATMREIREADMAVGISNPAAFLHCTSEYPAVVERAGLCGITRLIGEYASFPNREIGISDHTVGPIVPIAATAMGATIIEKHIRLNGDQSSEDASFSLDERLFAVMVHQVRNTWQAMQKVEAEHNPSRQLRRSLYAVADIEEGEPFTEANVRSIRPGYGLPPKALPLLMGKKAKHDFKKGDRIR